MSLSFSSSRLLGGEELVSSSVTRLPEWSVWCGWRLVGHWWWRWRRVSPAFTSQRRRAAHSTAAQDRWLGEEERATGGLLSSPLVVSNPTRGHGWDTGHRTKPLGTYVAIPVHHSVLSRYMRTISRDHMKWTNALRVSPAKRKGGVHRH